MDIDSQFFCIVSSSGETYPSSLSLISSILFSLLSFDLTSNSLSILKSSLSDRGESSLVTLKSSLLIVSKEDTISLLSCVVVIPLLSIFKFLISSSNNFRISV